MLDFNAFVADDTTIHKALGRRGVDAKLLARVGEEVAQRKQAITALEALRYALNQASAAIEAAMRAGERDAAAQKRDSLRQLKGEIQAAEATVSDVEARLHALMLELPNVPADSVPEGTSEADNKVIRSWGEPQRFAHALNHWDIGERLGILDFDRASRISGARFAVLRGQGARLERALASFMLAHAAKHGFEEIAPPYLVRPESMVAAGQYPKFIGEAFETQNGEHALIPTSEIPLVNLHVDEILSEAELPRRYTAFTPCFRREAGAAGRDTRGLIRQHQFNKVELVAFCRPEDSEAEHERLTKVAEGVLQALELPYRVMALCCGDMGFAAAKTYDLEVWLPGQNTFREISSCSNCHDFQARRGKIRFRAQDGKKGKPKLVHTLNGSSLAVGRALVAVLENNLQPDLSVKIPAVLQPYMDGATFIAAQP